MEAGARLLVLNYTPLGTWLTKWIAKFISRSRLPLRDVCKRAIRADQSGAAELMTLESRDSTAQNVQHQTDIQYRTFQCDNVLCTVIYQTSTSPVVDTQSTSLS